MAQGLFWTPFDTSVSNTLGWLKENKLLFEHELEFVYNEDPLSQHANIDRELKKDSLHRQEMDDEKKAKQ